MTTGVPQGLTLGPLLFLIYLNDLPQISELPLYTFFADDAAVTIGGRNLDEIKNALNTVLRLFGEYCNENMLTVNTKKTEYVIFGTQANKDRAGKIDLVLNGETLREVDTYTYLGTTLDSAMNGQKQLGKLNQQLALKLTTFRKIRSYMSENTVIMLYKATILPVFDYNDLVYELLTKQQQARIQKILNRALRVVSRGKKK